MNDEQKESLRHFSCCGGRGAVWGTRDVYTPFKLDGKLEETTEKPPFVP